jgi:hypothetical protein
MSREIALPVSVNVQAPRGATARNRFLPNPCVNRLTSPLDIAGQTNIQREQAGHGTVLSSTG